MFNLFEVAAEPSVRQYIDANLYDPWVNTPFQGYVFLGAKKQGTYGERFISAALQKLGLFIDAPLNTGHDRQVGLSKDQLIKTEFKFSLAQRDCEKQIVKPDVFSINHMAISKDWDRMIFCGINPQPHQSPFIFITKEDFIAEMQLSEPVFKPQQSGKNGGNDDYIIQGIRGIREFLNRPYIQQITAW